MQRSGQTNDFNHSVDLQALSKMRSDDAPIFSLYLDLRAETQPAENLISRFNLLLQKAEQQKKLSQEPRPYQEQWINEAGKIRRYLEMKQPFQEPGLALFSSEAEGLWQVVPLPVPVVDRLVVKGQPYTRPLENLLGEIKGTMVVLLNKDLVRLVRISVGGAQEIDHLKAVPVTGGDRESGGRQFAQAVVDRLEGALHVQPDEQLVLAGSQEMVNDLRDELPVSLLEKLVGAVPISDLTGSEDFHAQVREIEQELERKIEARRVEELLSSVENNEPAVLGLDKTLLVVRSGKVRMLVVEEDFRPAGGECPNCGFLAGAEEKQCLLCGMDLRPEPDIIEVSINRVLEYGGEIEVLRSRQSRNALATHGQIGALLFEPGTEPVVKDMSNRQRITKDGEIDRDVLHDEAMEESFPGSDPPSF